MSVTPDNKDQNEIVFKTLMARFDRIKQGFVDEINNNNHDHHHTDSVEIISYPNDSDVIGDLVQYVKLIKTKLPHKYWKNVIFSIARGLNRQQFPQIDNNNGSGKYQLGQDIEIIGLLLEMEGADLPTIMSALVNENIDEHEAYRFALPFIAGIRKAMPIDLAKFIFDNMETNTPIAKKAFTKFVREINNFETEKIIPEMCLQEFIKRLKAVKNTEWLKAVASSLFFIAEKSSLSTDTADQVFNISVSNLLKGKAILPPLVENIIELGMCAEKNNCIAFSIE